MEHANSKTEELSQMEIVSLYLNSFKNLLEYDLVSWDRVVSQMLEYCRRTVMGSEGEDS